ncbi:ead/Ea22-like family protein [Salmonella enterica subsp. enterica serovar Virchow]|uniref:Ead/Ea22-like family protein n=1 Tax=Salmonella virchow TaxID=48409 RepID=A0A5H9TGM6_SALVI|nr:ead/Ea22-like family protein [Salmonella enterica]EBG5517416.1 ead/Ea22-like family protein [Salmonella enterica subsp. enterica serovar Virchow]EBV7185879.1 ead/Ea22-like family protein [Salmonella enterica subsp. enterica serovar Braenderup]EAN3431561.1 ead/Ea22-like family protein [Salmonella enterica]EBR8590052.1 ead/Ea22-like family protein [Salmonella enterica subsp. enterica serovar Virchow]EBS3191706.1 ead/Ea22-like family protein [Salmonella enterica subsp. enterica serovar Virchow
MNKIDYQALRGAAEAIKIAATPQKLLAFRMKVTPQVVLALLDERDALNERLAELEADLAGLAEDQQKSIESIKQADEAVKLAHEKFSALAAENAALKQSEKEFNDFCREEFSEWEDDITETPATDAFLAEVRAQGVEMAMEHMQSSGSLTFGDCYISLNEFAAQLRKGVPS